MKKFSFLPAAIYALSYEEIQSFGSLDQGRYSRTEQSGAVLAGTVRESFKEPF